MLLLGLDVGTTSVKATVFNEKGMRQGQGMQGYEVHFPGEGRAEQDAELVWQKACLAVREAVGERGSQVAAVSLSVQGDAVLLIDALGNPLGPVQLGMDYRGRAEVQRLEACFGTENLHLRTGMAPHPLCALPKMMWLVQQEPTLWERAWKAVTYEEFFLLRMGCEEAIIDETMASRTLAYSMQGNCWDQEILAQAGISLEKMSRICSSGEVVGTVSKKCSQEMGLWTGAALVAGAHDQVCAALGAGVGGPGTALDSHGTAEVLSAVLSGPIRAGPLLHQGYPSYCFAVPKRYFTFGLNHQAGIVFQWYRNTMQSTQSFDEIMNALPISPTSLFFVLLKKIKGGYGLAGPCPPPGQS